jgi:hypothetical protein
LTSACAEDLNKKLGVSARDTPSRQAKRVSAFSRPFSFRP